MINTSASTKGMEDEIYGQEPAWYPLLQRTKAGEIVTKGRTIVSANYAEEVGTILTKLADAKVLSAVITDSGRPGVFGFIDVFDLLCYALEVTQGRDLTKESIENLKWQGKVFARKETGLLVNNSQVNPYVTVTEDTPLIDVVKVLASEVHRVAIVDKIQKERILNIVSQSDVVKFLAQRGVWIGSKLEKPLTEVGLGPNTVASVREDMTTIDVLRYMKQLSVSGVPVVDKSGRIIGNFSATDLLGLTEDNFLLLGLNVKDFLLRMYGFPKPPVFCRPNDTVETLMLKFTVHKVHRIYLVNDKMQPIGIISLTDVMQFLLAG